MKRILLLAVALTAVRALGVSGADAGTECAHYKIQVGSQTLQDTPCPADPPPPFVHYFEWHLCQGIDPASTEVCVQLLLHTV